MSAQGSNEWRQERCGSLGASQVHDVIAKTKSGPAASRANLMAMMICERLTGIPYEGFTSAAMQHGIDKEPDARAAYAWHADANVVEVGVIRHPSIKGAHASPDGLVDDNGLVEIKCPASATHIDILLSGAIPTRYVTQMQWQLACTGRMWCDFVSFDDRLPDSMRLFVKRVERDNAFILDLEKQVTAFLEELDAKLNALRTGYDPIAQFKAA